MFNQKAVVALFVLTCLFGTALLLTPSEPVLADCCSSTCYAWRKRPDLKAVCTREAHDWDDDARQHGLDVSKIPEVGAIVVLGASVQGADSGRDCRETGGLYDCLGHVAYVEKVLRPVRFTVSQKVRSQDSAVCDTWSRAAYIGVDVSFIYETPHISPSFHNLDPETGRPQTLMEPPSSMGTLRAGAISDGTSCLTVPL